MIKDKKAFTEFRKFLQELYLAKEFLTHQKGQTRDPSAPNYIQYRWGDYCEAIGLTRQVADYWVRKYAQQDAAQPIRPPVWWCLGRAKKPSAGESEPAQRKAGKRRVTA